MVSKLNEEFRIDSEYYKQKYLKEDREIKQFHQKKIRELAFVTDGQHGYHEVDEFSDIHMLTAKNAKDWFANLAGAETVAKWVDENNKRSSLQVDDIILSTRGTIGCCAIVTDEILPANIDQDIARIEINDNSICSEFLLTYLNSRYGQDCMERNKTGMVQQGLTLQKVRDLNIPIMSIDFQNTIKYIIKDIVYLNLKLAEKKYQEAETLLLSALNLANFTPTTENKSVKTFAETFASGRLDAEYYQKKYDEIFNTIEDLKNSPYVFKVSSLGNITDIKKSIEPGSESYTDKGVPFIRVADVSKYEIQEPKIYLNETDFNFKELNPNKDTILLSKDGTVGIAYKVQNDMKALTSSALLHLIVTDDAVNPDYLTLLLNSVLVSMQAERDVGGSILKHWRIEEIKRVKLPILQMNIQTKISAKVKESFALREQSKTLLKSAVKAVETAIEDGEEKAMEYLRENH